MRRSGFTLIEMLAAISLLTAAPRDDLGAWLQASATADVLGKKTDATDRAITPWPESPRYVRSRASLSALPAAGSPTDPEDLDANGLPIDADGMPEWSGLAGSGSIQRRQWRWFHREPVDIGTPGESRDCNGFPQPSRLAPRRAATPASGSKRGWRHPRAMEWSA